MEANTFKYYAFAPMGRFQLELIFVYYLAWAVDIGFQITDVGRSLYIGPFCPAMTSLSRYLEEAAFSMIFKSIEFIAKLNSFSVYSNIVFLTKTKAYILLHTCHY